MPTTTPTTTATAAAARTGSCATMRLSTFLTSQSDQSRVRRAAPRDRCGRGPSAGGSGVGWRTFLRDRRCHGSSGARGRGPPRRFAHGRAGRLQLSAAVATRRSQPRVVLPSPHRPVPGVAIVIDTSGSMALRRWPTCWPSSTRSSTHCSSASTASSGSPSTPQPPLPPLGVRLTCCSSAGRLPEHDARHFGRRGAAPEARAVRRVHRRLHPVAGRAGRRDDRRRSACRRRPRLPATNAGWMVRVDATTSRRPCGKRHATTQRSGRLHAMSESATPIPDEVVELVRNARAITVFTGAGMSAERDRHLPRQRRRQPVGPLRPDDAGLGRRLGSRPRPGVGLVCLAHGPAQRRRAQRRSSCTS